jgi:hypothetical protein
MVKLTGILLSAAPHIERLQKPASFFQILLEPAFDLFTAGASGNRECLGTPQ